MRMPWPTGVGGAVAPKTNTNIIEIFCENLSEQNRQHCNSTTLVKACHIGVRGREGIPPLVLNSANNCHEDK
jgi:hypothetical protein